MENYGRGNKNDNKIRVDKQHIRWNCMTEQEKDEIKERARLKREEEERTENKKKAEIMLGVQKTIENSWE